MLCDDAVGTDVQAGVEAVAQLLDIIVVTTVCAAVSGSFSGLLRSKAPQERHR